MAEATSHPRITTTVEFTIDEQEARALDALSGYGDDAFIEAFHEKLGKAYMNGHEDGLRRFLKTIRSVVGPALAQVDEARMLLRHEAAERQRERLARQPAKEPS